MRRLILLSVLTFSLLVGGRAVTFAQTTLSAGDLVIVSINGDDDATYGKGFSFMPLVNLEAGTIIRFTDYGWSDTNGAFITNTSVSDNFIYYTAPAGGITAGTVIRCSSKSSPNFTFESTYSGVGSNSYLSLGGLTQSDEVLVFQGSIAAPTFIFAATYVSTAISATGWATSVGSNGTDGSGAGSGLPPGLTNDQTALSFNQVSTANDNSSYSGPTSGATKAQWQTRIQDYVNWTFNDGPTIPIPPVGPFYVGEPVVVPTVTTTAASSIATTSATLGGNVTADGGATVTDKGIVYSTGDATPTVAEGATKVSMGSGTGSFSQSVGSLAQGTTYYYNAYGYNSSGYGYGTASSFTTLAPEINIKGNGADIADGSSSTSTSNHTDFGSTPVCNTTIVRTFTVQNTGSGSLTISSVNITGTHNTDFSVTSSPASTVAASGSTTFQVTFNPSASGTRTATITVNNNDSNEGAYDFAIQGTGTNLTISASSQTNIACNGGSNGAASVSAATGGTSSYTYDWTPSTPTGDGTTSITGLTAGTWTCTVTDANGCTASQNFTVTQPTALSLTAASQTNVSCNGGSNGAASVNTATGGAGGYTYDWTPGTPTGDGTISVTGLTAGTWTCTVTDANGCTALRNFTITQPTALSLTVASQTNVSVYGGSNGAASVNTASGGAGGYTYDWTSGNPTGDGTTSVTGLTAGAWTCTVTDANGCTASQNFTLLQPPAITTSAATSVSTTAATLGGSITSDGGNAISARGIVYSTTDATPTIGESGVTQDTNGDGTGSFSESVGSLSVATRYYYQAYATNTIGTTYGGVQEFTTQNTVSSIVRSGSSPANAASVSWTVTFAASVTGLTSSNFSLANTGLTGPSITSVAGSGTSWTVTAGTGTGSGSLGVNLVNSTGLNSGISNSLPYTGEVYTIDKTNPLLSSSNPADNSVTAYLGSNIVLNFDENVVAGTDNITIRNSSDNTIFEQIAITDSRVTISGSQVTVNPSGIFSKGTGYYVEIDGTALTDNAGNSFAGISGSTTLNFTTVDVVINEVVTEAKRDWNTFGFTGIVGAGAVTDYDEWIELYINTTGINLSAWTIELMDGSNIIGNLSALGAFVTSRYFGTGSFTNTISGDYLVLGRGNGSPMNNDITINLKDPTGAIVDVVTFIDPGLPNSNSEDQYDESAQRFTNGTDTNAAGDWTQGAASMGAANTGPSVTISVNNATIAEAAGTSTITATLSAKSSQTTTVNLSTSGTGTSATDYTLSSTSISISAGSLTGTATITSVQDTKDEDDETVVIDITSVTNGTEAGTQQQTVTITDDDEAPTVTLSVSPASIAENDTPETSTITATLSAVSAKTVTVTITATSVAAVASTDYSLASSTITINPGNSTGTTTLSSIQDADVEGHQTIDIDITGVTNGTENGVQKKTITLLDDDLPKVTLSQSVVSFAEAAGTNTITATLDATFSEDAVITIGANASSTATGGGTDYSLSSTTITILAGSYSGTATITAVQDLLDETDETVIIDVISCTNSIENGTQQVTSTIADDDPLPTVAFNSTSSGGAESVSSANLQVDLSAVSGLSVSVDYSVTGTAGGSGTDYTLANGTLTITAGDANKNITIASIVDDLLDENNETVIVTLSNPTNATLGTNTVHTYTITDNDATPTVAFNSISSGGAESVSSANLQVGLSAVSGLSVSVDYTVTGTATGSGTDYILANGTLTFNAGETSKNITIASIVDDLLDENNETVIVTFSNPVNAILGTNTVHTYTIEDNDATPTVAFNSTSSGGVESASSANLQVDLSAASGLSVSVDYSVTGTAGGSGTDYTLANGTLTIPAGDANKNITIASIIDDLLDENNETVIVTLSNPVNATLGTNTVHTYTITDNDPTPTVAFNSTSSSGTESVSSANLQVDLSAASGLSVSVDYSVTGTAGGSGTDYTLANGTLTITAGDANKNITIASIVDDLLDENNETVIVTLSNPTNATLGTNTVHTYTIDDNDEPPTVTLSVSPSNISEAPETSTITATLSAVSSKTVIVTISANVSGTATGGGTDYYLSSTSITINAGSLTGTSTVTSVQDTDAEGDETIIIDIYSVINGTESGTQQQTITIIDDDAPTVSSVSVPANGIYRTGQNLDFTVTFNQAVTINTSGGIPSIPVTIGVTTVHALLSGTVSGATGATFRYTVLNNQEDANGITLGSAIATNGATIQNAALLNAITTLNNVGSTSAVLIDAVVPTLTASLPADNASNATLSGNIVLTFDDTMQAGSGNITIKKSSDGSIFEQVASNDSKVTFATTQVTVNPSGILEKGTAYYLEIDNAALKDDAGNPFAGISGSTTLNFTTVNVVVNEIVTDPQQDWSSTSFASVPGGSAGTNDEWIELFIQSDGIDLSGWTITVDDGVLFSGDLSNTGAFDVSNYIGTGVFGNTKSGDYLVLGNPDGSNTMNDTGLTIQLKDPGGAVVDAVTIGGGSGEAPSGNAAGIYDEAVQRFANGTDTNTDSSDFTRGMASLGAANTGPSVTLTSSKTSVSENNQSATITATLSAPSSQSTTVNLSVSGTAISGTDYSVASSGITIPAGSSSGTAMLTSIQDAIDEEDETVIIDILSVTNGTENGTQQKTVTITDDDPAPAVAFNLTSSSGAESVGSANLQVDLSAASGLTVTVDYTVTGTASGSGTDYTLANGTLTFNAGETSKNITIASIVDDLLDENNETVIVTLSNPVNATIGTNTTHTYTITDNDPTPTVAFNTTSSNGTESVSSANLQVDLSAASGLTVTVDYTVTGTASGSGTDYTLANGILTFNAGETSKNITIASIIDDLLDENNETVIVTLSNPINVTIGTNATHTYTITDNDPTPTVAFNTTSSNGTESVSSSNLQVELSAAGGLTVTVDYTVSGTASGSGTDYTLANGTLTFNAGETSKNITIASIVDDLLDENNETVIVTLSNPVNATLGTNTTHTYTITDNDPTPTVAFNTTSSNGAESVSSANLQVDLSAASGLTVTVDYTVLGTASGSGTDYTLANGTLTFNAGETSKNITIASIVDDLLDENNETVIVTLSNPVNATLGINTVHTYTIDDNDEPPTVTLSVSPSNISEAPETSTITVTLSAVSSKTVIVTISANVSGTATGGGTDYTLSSTSITINAGGLTGTTTIVSVQDSEGEGDETIIIDIVSVSNGTESGTQQQTITIIDDDAPTVTSVAVPSDGIYRASQNLDFTVTFNQPVSINTSGGTPYIPVTIGSTVVNASLSGTVTNSTTALLRYTVQTGQEDTNGITVGSAVSVNGSTIRNAAGLDAITTLNSVGSTTNVKVDAIVPVAPVVTGISTDSNTAADGITSDNSLLINGTSEPNATVEVFINTVSAGTTAANGTGNWQFDHTATVLPDGNYSLTAKATDAAGNISAASTAYTVTVDTAKPSVVITGSATNPTNSAFTATFTFNEGVYNFAIGDITVGNGLASNFSATSVTVYTATITPVTNGVVTVDVAAGVSNDLSGNTNTVATQYSITYDTVKPTVTISSPAPNPANSAFTATFTFSEAVTGFTIDDITVGNGSSGSFTATSASVYTATVTPLSDGTVTVDVNADVAQDAAGNKNTVAARYSVTYDATRPGVTITGKDINHLNKSFTAEFTFSEAVTGFTAGDITLSVGTVNNFSAVSSTLYSALVKDAFASSVLVDVATGLAIDAAGNTNTAATTLKVEFDETPPTVYCRDTVLYLNTSGNAGITAQDLDNGSHDHFGIAGMKIDKSTFTCDNLGSNTVILTVTDNSGNISTCNAIVTVVDTITVKTKDITILLDATGKAAITPDQVDDGSFSACGIVSYKLDKTEFDCSNYGLNTVILTVTGRGGNTKSGTAVVTVESVNRAPVFDPVSNAEVQEDVVSFTVQITGIKNGDCEGVVQQVKSVTAAATGSIIEKTEVAYTAGQESAVLTIFLKKDVSGEATVTVTAKDNGGTANNGTDTYSSGFKVTVLPVNDAPVLAGNIDPQKAEVGKAFLYTLPSGLFTDIDEGDELTYSVTAKTGSFPGWLSFDSSTLSFSGTPGESDKGNFLLKITATDKSGESASTYMEIIVYQTTSSVLAGYLYQKSELLNGGATVALYERIGEVPTTVFKLITRTTVSSHGSFGFYNLSPGRYIVEATIIDQEKYGNLLTTYFDQSDNWSDASAVLLENNSTRYIDMVMLEKPVQNQGSFIISGFIIQKTGNTTKSGLIEKSAGADSGEPLAGVNIQLKQDGKIIATCISDENGHYEFKGLPEGVYQIEVMVPGFSQQEVVAVEMNEQSTVEEEVNFTVWEGTNVITDLEIHRLPVEVKIYPNPTSGKLTVGIENRYTFVPEIRVYSITGQLIFEKTDIRDKSTVIDLSGQNPGIYLLRVTTGHDQQTHQVILK